MTAQILKHADQFDPAWLSWLWLDFRGLEEFKSRHFVQALSMDGAFSPRCLNFLPAPPASLGCIVPSSIQDEQRNAIYQHFADKGYPFAAMLDAALLADLADAYFTSSSLTPRFWSVNPVLQEFIADILPSGAQGQALDLGCGGGRESVYLAMQGWQVTALDQQRKALDCAQALAERFQVEVDWRCVDLRHSALRPRAQFDVIMMFRFLDASLYGYIKQALKPGGYVLIQTFYQGVEKWGSPKNPNLILKEGELRKEFSDFERIVDRIDAIEDGRPVQSFIARRQL